ncbi:hypothetical protein D9M69_603190 [compost metagenome]
MVGFDQFAHHEALGVHLVEAAAGGLVGLRRSRLAGQQAADGALLVRGVQALPAGLVQQHAAQHQRRDRLAHGVAGLLMQRQFAFQVRVAQFDAIDDDRHVGLLETAAQRGRTSCQARPR